MEIPEVGEIVNLICLEDKRTYAGKVLSVFEGLEVVIVSIADLLDVYNVIYYRKGG